MKKILSALLIAITLVSTSCSKKDADPQPSTTQTTQTPTPTSDDVAVDTTSLKSANARIDVCELKNILTAYNLTGLLPNHPKKWYIKYYDAVSGVRLDVPGLISPTQNNTFYWKQNHRLVEYSYLDRSEQGFPMDTGTYHVKDCGNTSLINTNLSGGDNPFVLVKVTPIYWEGTFFIPAGPGGALVNVRVKARLTDVNY